LNFDHLYIKILILLYEISIIRLIINIFIQNLFRDIDIDIFRVKWVKFEKN